MTTAYNRSFSFSNYQATNPSIPLPGGSLDTELNAVKATTDSLTTNLGLIQRADGALSNGVVGRDQLSAGLQTGFNPPTVWASSTPYFSSPANTVFVNSKFYSCAISHTSGLSFATDLAAAKWALIADLAGIPLVSANQIAITPSGGIVLTDMQSAAYGLDTRITANALALAAFASGNITDSTTTGRAVLTASTADAALAAIGGPTTGDVMFTLQAVAPAGWRMFDDGTIGDAGSGAIYSNALALPLFTLMYNNFVDANCAIILSTGVATTRAAQTNAATAWTNHCRIALPKVLGRALAAAGAGSGLTSRALGVTVGEETHLLATTELPSHTHANTLNDPTHTHTFPAQNATGGAAAAINSVGAAGVTITTAAASTGVTITNAAAGGGTAHNIMQPTVFLNVKVKL